MCAISGKSTLTAIEGILIDAREDGTCTMTTFDLEKGMRIQVQANVEEAGCYILNAQKFSQTVRVMDGDREVARQKKMIFTPGEMAELNLKPEMIKGLSGGDVTIQIEQ